MPEIGARGEIVTRLFSIAAGTAPEFAEAPERFVTSAAAAGWAACGVWFEPDTWTDATTREVRLRLQDGGLTAVDMEVVHIGRDGECGDRLVDAAAGVGARNVLAVSWLPDVLATAHRLAELCRRAAPAGISVCIEFMRFTEVKTLADAVKVADRVDEPNIGILADLLHVARSGTTFEDIRQADPGLLPYAQWCDATAEPRGWSTRDLIVDALDDRCSPGHGALRAAEFEALFDETVPFSLEVRSRRLRNDFPDPTQRARHLLHETRAALGNDASGD